MGAHRGLEAEVYNWFGKNVIWVEALPKTYIQLKENLYFYKNQLAYQALLADKDDEIVDFHISNYDAACSSIFTFTENIKKSDVWSDRNHQMINTCQFLCLRRASLFYLDLLEQHE